MPDLKQSQTLQSILAQRERIASLAKPREGPSIRLSTEGFHIRIGDEVQPEALLSVASALHARGIDVMRGAKEWGRREGWGGREALGEAELLLTQALVLRDRVGSSSDEIEHLSHLELISDLGVCLAQASRFEESHAIQTRALEEIRGQERTYAGFLEQVNVRVAALAKARKRFQQLAVRCENALQS